MRHSPAAAAAMRETPSVNAQSVTTNLAAFTNVFLFHRFTFPSPTGQHAHEDVVALDEVMPQRRRHVHPDDDRERDEQRKVYALGDLPERLVGCDHPRPRPPPDYAQRSIPRR